MSGGFDKRGGPDDRSGDVPGTTGKAPGKVTRTSKLPQTGNAPPAPVQKKPDPAADTALMRQEAETASWMQVVMRPDLHGEPMQAQPAATRQEPASFLLPTGPVQCKSEDDSATASQSGASAASSPGAIDPPQAGINKPGFIDTSDGSNIRTRPAELAGSTTLTAAPLPSATRVFVSGRHPEAPQWWYVSAFVPGAIVRGYVQGLRVNTDLPEPSARLYQIKNGDTVERLAVQEFSAAVQGGHDLRYYENVLLAVNRDKGRAGIKGTFQDPGIFGGGADNIQLEAGRRIWLVSPAYARALEGVVPDGSLTNGTYAKAKRVLGHIDDLVQSVTDSPKYFGAVAGDYADAIKDHLPEIIGITAGFIVAESASAFLAATPTGVGQLAAVIIQLGLAALGAGFAASAGVQALEHGKEWLILAWTARGDATRLAQASQAFLHMLVSIAMAALAIAGVRGNMGKGLKVADSIHIQPPRIAMSPAMVGAGGRVFPGGPAFIPGSITSAGPVNIGISAMSGLGAGGSKAGSGRNKGGRDRHGGGIKQIEQVAIKYKMTPEQRRAFGDYVEQEKMMSGRGGADNYTWKELEELAQEFLNNGGY